MDTNDIGKTAATNSEESLISVSNGADPSRTVSVAGNQSVAGAQKPASVRSLYLKIAWLGLCFSLVLTGYNTSQGFVTTIFPNNGFYLLFLLSAVFGVSSSLAPSLNRYLNKRYRSGLVEKWTIFAASFGYLIFVLCIQSHSLPMVYIGSVAIGAGSGLFWINQGIYLSKQIEIFKNGSHSTKHEHVHGTTTGVFFTLFNLNGIVGSIISIILLYFDSDLYFLIWILAAVTATGCVLLSFSAPAKSYSSLNDIPKQESPASIKETLWKTWRFFINKKTLLLIPYHFCQGVSNSYSYGNYPRAITFILLTTAIASSETPPDENTKAFNISIGFLLYGIGCMVGSFLWGKVYDWFHSKIFPLLLSHILLISINFILLMTVILTPVLGTAGLSILFANGFVFGLCDFLSNNIINSVSSKNYSGEEVGMAFSIYRIWFSIGWCVASLLSAFVPPLVSGDISGWLFMIIFNLCCVIVSVTCGYILERKYLD